MLIEQFASKVRTETGSFVLNDNNKFYYFIQGKAGEARYVYGCYGFEKDFYITSRNDLALIAVIKDDCIYILQRYFFDLFSDSNWKMLKDTLKIFDFYDLCQEINKDIAANVFPALFEQLPIEEITDDKKMEELKQTARSILLLGKPIKNAECNIALDTYSVMSILCGLATVQDIVEKLFLENDKYYRWQKTSNYIIQELLQSSDIATDWEKQLSESLLAVDAKTVTVYFTVNGRTDYGKMEPQKILKRLVERNHFYDYDFCVTMRGASVIKNVGATTNRFNEDNCPVLTCEHITKIVYGRKVLYER